MSPRLGPLRVLALAVLVCSILSCSDADSDEQTATSGSGATSDTAAATTDPAPPKTGTLQPTPDTIADGAEGSGCTPASSDTLPDGRWYGVVAGADDAELTFDLACFFTSEAAVVAAAADGEESPPPNDYHIRNANDLLRTFQVSADASVTWYPDGGSPTDVTTVDYGQWLIDRQGRGFDLAVWLTISNGAIADIEEQWVP